MIDMLRNALEASLSLFVILVTVWMAFSDKQEIIQWMPLID